MTDKHSSPVRANECKSEDRLLLVLVTVTIGFVIAVVFHYILGCYLGYAFPHNTFLFNPGDVGRDFAHIQNAVNKGDPYAYRWSVYFPFMYAPLALGKGLPIGVSLLGFTAVFFIGCTWFIHSSLNSFSVYLRILAVFSLSMMTYPVLFCVDRGNLEGLVFIALAGFFAAFERKRMSIAAICLAGATAMKLYPGIFVLLFLAEKKYKEVIILTLLTLVFTFGSATFFPGGISGSVASLGSKLVEYKTLYIVGDNGLAFGTSYFGVIKILLQTVNLGTPEKFSTILPIYAVCCMVAFAALSWFVIFVEPVFWRRVAILTTAMILFPHVSADYKLIHLIFPVVFFLSCKQFSNHDIFYAVLFGLLLIPKAYYWLRGDISIAVILNPLLLTILTLALICDRLRDPVNLSGSGLSLT